MNNVAIASLPTASPLPSATLPVHQFVLDGYACDRAACDSLQVIWDLLDQLPEELGLGKASIPYLIPYYKGLVPADCGITGIVYTVLGHITVHTFSAKQTVFVDITSPRPFDAALAERRFVEALGIGRVEARVLDRATPTGVMNATNEWRGFGPHLTIDIADYDAERLGMAELFDLLSELPADVHMTKIMTPYVIRYETEAGEQAISGLVLIAESHISFHLLPERRIGYVDLFSCKPFDVEKTLDLVRERAGIRRDVVTLTGRGLDFPRS